MFYKVLVVQLSTYGNEDEVLTTPNRKRLGTAKIIGGIITRPP